MSPPVPCRLPHAGRPVRPPLCHPPALGEPGRRAEAGSSLLDSSAPLFFGEEALTLFLLLREMHLEPNEGSKV